ncbi:MAG: pyruvate dehydrogenase (acetyl-transferring) E1 component subunit alpha [Deltaproteobacteria bacterium]|nr:pyruvate dehydrogenase (acetyl-transferring) E1 component subunit alpha [Deltaproteobacteria bacterium]MBW1994561.1 pyruvate dehydrogenase (acetyl-transferring) E1 component subunit alpha [Deltaproteobacteria bacterium]MBW2154800.1 pyruvate dehydrogenase (acetyl-transferring) E1 component subunit alpha [Deltaproteobacteria bacterium]
MPRKKIDVPNRIDYLSVLDENGKIDTAVEPKIEDSFLLKLYRFMLLARRFDERQLSLQRQGRIGTFAPIKGQEAAQLGAVAVLRPSDWMVPSFRETAAELWLGRTMESVIIYNAGFNEGARIEEDRNDLPISIPVGTQVLHAAGLGWAIKYRKKDDVVMTFFGDGATSEGDFHEGLNMAAVFGVPVIFVCQNNQWAISVPRSKQTRSETIAQKAAAYGMPGLQVDGNDILAVYTAAQEAVNRARAGKGPTLIECVTYRVTMHTTADDPKKYRPEEEVEIWKKRDPILRFQKYLTNKNLLSERNLEEFETEIEAEVQAALDRAEEQMKSMGDPLDMFEHLYAELPAHLKKQREILAQELSERQKETSHG